MKGYFITGTDTGVGKTTVSAVMTLVLQGTYWKPIQSGVADELSDCEQVKLLTQLGDQHFHPSNYLLKAGISPNQAAELENITIDLKQCQPPVGDRHVIVEGAGGVYVPLNASDCMLDFMRQCNLPVIIVSRGTLGTINHTLMSIALLKQWKISICGVVFSKALHLSSQCDIEKWGGVRTLFHLPEFEHLTADSLQAWTRQHQQKIVESLL